MPQIRETPSSIMYTDLRTFGGISNKDAAYILLNTNLTLGGRPLFERIESRTWLSREVVHVDPTNVNPALFADFYASTRTIYGQVSRHVAGANKLLAVAQHYAGPAAKQMCQVLEDHGLDAQVYRNEVSRLCRVQLNDERDRPLLLLMLFCVTGCIADARQATGYVENYAQNRLANDLRTITAAPATSIMTAVQESQASSLGLIRVVNGAMQPPVIALEPAGSEVGALAEGRGAVTNVGPDVSRRHARIWRDGTRWLCCGLESTNGTAIISGEDGSIQYVEPPRNARAEGVIYPPCEIHEGDTLCFGRNTRFLVLRINS